jgi:hypothetical protein
MTQDVLQRRETPALLQPDARHRVPELVDVELFHPGELANRSIE